MRPFHLELDLVGRGLDRACSLVLRFIKSAAPIWSVPRRQCPRGQIVLDFWNLRHVRPSAAPRRRHLPWARCENCYTSR
jgi:hypothetical protein